MEVSSGSSSAYTYEQSGITHRIFTPPDDIHSAYNSFTGVSAWLAEETADGSLFGEMKET